MGGVKPLGMVLLILLGGFLTFWGTLMLVAPTVGDFLIAVAVPLSAGAGLLYGALRLVRSM